MIIESGCIVALGIIILFFKSPWKVRMWMLSNPIKMDVFIFVVLNALHWGTFSGVMVAATGALICSALLGLGKHVYGFVDAGKYKPGFTNVGSKLV